MSVGPSDEEAVRRRYYRMPDVKRLFALSFNECALPGCEERLADPAWPEVLAEICHIYGLKPGSPRYVPGMTVEEVNAYENLLLLCPTCHRKVDYVLVEEYPAERLFALKRGHEERRGSEREWCSSQHLEACVRKLAVSLGIHLIGGTEESETQPESPVSTSGSPKRIRVYELARELDLTNKEALDLCLQLGITVKSHSSSVRDPQADRVRRLHAQLAGTGTHDGSQIVVPASGAHGAGRLLDADGAPLGRMTGVVKWFDDEKGYGFISPASGRDVFVHYTSIVGRGRRTLAQGQHVRMNVVEGTKGVEAREVVVTDAATDR